MYKLFDTIYILKMNDISTQVATRTDEECFRDFFEVKGTQAPGHSGQMKTDFFRPVGYAAKNKLNREEEESVEVDSSKDLGFKRALVLFFPMTLRNLTSSIYDVLTGFTVRRHLHIWIHVLFVILKNLSLIILFSQRPKDILKSDTRHLEACLRANIGDFTFQEAFDRT